MDYAATGKQFVFIVVLLGVFFTLVMTMPGGFYVVAPDYDETDYPTYWSESDIRQVRFHDEENITYNDPYWTYFEIVRTGIDTVYVKAYWRVFLAYSPEPGFYLQHHNWGIFGWGVGNIEDYPILESEVLANVDETGNTSRFSMYCDHHNFIVYFANNGSFADLETALDNGAIAISVGMDWDYEGGMLSGWDLIARLLTFQLPNITPELNFLIGIPLWALIGFLTFAIIMFVINALPFT